MHQQLYELHPGEIELSTLHTGNSPVCERVDAATLRWCTGRLLVGESVSDFISEEVERQFLMVTCTLLSCHLLFSHTLKAGKGYWIALHSANCFLEVYSSKTKFHR